MENIMKFSNEELLEIVQLHQQFNDTEFVEKVMEKFPSVSAETAETINKLIIITLDQVMEFIEQLTSSALISGT